MNRWFFLFIVIINMIVFRYSYVNTKILTDIINKDLYQNEQELNKLGLFEK